MQGFIKPRLFLFLGDPDRPPRADDLEDDDGHNEGVDRHDDHAEELHEELMDAGALKGTGNGAIDISEDVVRGAIIGMRYAEARNPRYYSLDDVPTWAREETQKLIDRGALQGDGKHAINVTYDALQAMIVCQRMIDAAGGGK